MPDTGEQIFVWLEQQPEWQRHLFASAAADAVPGDDLDAAYAHLKHDNGIETETTPALTALTREELVNEGEAGSDVSLVSIGKLVEIGALADEAGLSFGSTGLTLVFGENAAGKTSYTRLLKFLGRAAHTDDLIRRNVFAPNPQEEQEATIRIHDGAEERNVTFKLSDPPPADLAGLRIFDGNSADVYVAEERTVDFTPRQLERFDRVANAQGELKARAELEVNELSEAQPQFDELHPTSPSRAKVDALSHETDVEELIASTILSEADETRLAELTRNAALVTLGQAAQQANALESLAGRAETAKLWSERLTALAGNEAVDQLRALEAASVLKSSAELAARSEAFSDEPIDEVGNSVWNELWEAARKFNESRGADFPPKESDNCPACLQEIDVETAERMSDFESFVISTVSREAREANDTLRAAREAFAVEVIPGEGRQEVMDGLAAESQELHDATDSYLRALERRVQEILGTEQVPEAMGELPGNPDAALAAHADDLRERAVAIRNLPEDGNLQALRAELEDLEDRQRISTRAADIRRFVSTEKKIHQLTAVKRALNTRNLTLKQDELAKEILDDSFKAEYQALIDGLGLSHLKCEPKHRADRGTTVMGVKFEDGVEERDVEAVLSGGEKRALALCFYLAEARVAPGNAPMVLDDPVSSLDRDRRALVADALIADIRNGQVVVFTHDPAFMYDLIEMIDASGLPIHASQIFRYEEVAGYVDVELPAHVLPPLERLNTLEGKIGKMPDPTTDGIESHRTAVRQWYTNLREVWERAIEFTLFNRTVERQSRGVSTLSLREVEIDSSHRDEVFAGMTNCSKYAHDQALQANVAVPDSDAMKADVVALREFVKRVTDERTARAKENSKAKKAVPSIVAAKATNLA